MNEALFDSGNSARPRMEMPFPRKAPVHSPDGALPFQREPVARDKDVCQRGPSHRLHELETTSPASPLTLPDLGHSPQVLSYQCGHTIDASGVRIGWVPAGAYLKEILTICPECARKQPRPKRVKPYDWGDVSEHSI